MEKIVPPPLHKGSRIALCATARAVSPEEMKPAFEELERWELEVIAPEGLYSRWGQLAGTDQHRAEVMQKMIDDPSIDAILCCRGGYGTVRVVDRVDFSSLREHPKWIVGYSDATVLHSHLHQCFNLSTLHATMPIHFATSPTAATESLRHALFGRPIDIGWHTTERIGEAVELEAVEIVGGNLSILYSLLGSHSQIDTCGKILFIEDLDEYLYHIDRMLQALRRAGMFDGARAIIVGGMSDLHDNAIPFGRTVMEMLRDALEGRSIPVVCDAPFGHIGEYNLALPLGRKINFSCDNQNNCRIFAPDLCYSSTPPS